jgi:hypothetical protein
MVYSLELAMRMGDWDMMLSGGEPCENQQGLRRWHVRLFFFS